MHQHRAFSDRLIDRFQNRIKQSDGNRLPVTNWKLNVMNSRGTPSYALLAKGDHGLNLMNVVCGQPLRVGERAQEESRGTRELQKSPVGSVSSSSIRAAILI